MAFFEILYGEGISREGELIDLGVENNLVEKAGSWYSYNGEKIGQGKDKVRTFLQENPEIANDIEQQLRAKLITKQVRNSDVIDDIIDTDEPALEEA